MNKFLSGKLFVVLSTSLTLLIGIGVGFLLGYQPQVEGSVWTTPSFSMYGDGKVSGKTSTTYIFDLKTALGYWLLAILLTYVVFLFSVLIRNIYKNKLASENN